MRRRYSSRALRAQAGRLLATASTCSLATRRRLLELYFLVAPELFQVVVAAHGRMHDVHDDVAEVDQHPLAVAPAFDAEDLGAELLELRLHMGGERVHLAIGVAAGDHNAFEMRGLLCHVEDEDVASLDVLERIHDRALFLADVHQPRYSP